MDIWNVVVYPRITQTEDGPLFGRGEVTFVVQTGIHVTKSAYMCGFLLLILGKNISYHIKDAKRNYFYPSFLSVSLTLTFTFDSLLKCQS